MNPGELKCRVTFLKETKVADGQGGYATEYIIRGKVWAKLAAATAKTKDQYEQLTSEILHRITIRYRSDVVMSDRIQFGQRLFAQIGPPINEGERNAYLRLECREVVSDADND